MRARTTSSCSRRRPRRSSSSSTRLLITEEVLRHLVTRVDRPAKSARADGSELDELEDGDLPSGLDEDEDDRDVPEFIDESESEAAPAAID